MAELAPNPRLSRCGCEDYEVSLCVAHSCFTRDVGGAGLGGRGGTDTASGHGESVPDRDRGGGDWSVRDQSRQGSPRDNTSAANANIIQVSTLVLHNNHLKRKILILL